MSLLETEFAKDAQQNGWSRERFEAGEEDGLASEIIAEKPDNTAEKTLKNQCMAWCSCLLECRWRGVFACVLSHPAFT